MNLLCLNRKIDDKLNRAGLKEKNAGYCLPLIILDELIHIQKWIGGDFLFFLERPFPFLSLRIFVSLPLSLSLSFPRALFHFLYFYVSLKTLSLTHTLSLPSFLSVSFSPLAFHFFGQRKSKHTDYRLIHDCYQYSPFKSIFKSRRLRKSLAGEEKKTKRNPRRYEANIIW